MSATTMSAHADPQLAATVRDGIARAIAVVGLGGVGLIHLLDAPPSSQGAPPPRRSCAGSRR
jgi:hypothetical protein